MIYMRKVTRKTTEAFLCGGKIRIGNTYTDGESLFLYGHRIAWKDGGGGIWVNSCGYLTRTTFDRLNSIPGVRVWKSKGETYLNAEPWDGSPKKVR